MDTTYLESCSEELKLLISPILLPCNYGDIKDAKWFLMSTIEVYGVPTTSGESEGIAWDYWKKVVGTESPTNTAIDGRISYTPNGEIVSPWLRSTQRTNYVDILTASGAKDYQNNLNTQSSSGVPYAVRPACFIAKSE